MSYIKNIFISLILIFVLILPLIFKFNKQWWFSFDITEPVLITEKWEYRPAEVQQDEIKNQTWQSLDSLFEEFNNRFNSSEEGNKIIWIQVHLSNLYNWSNPGIFLRHHSANFEVYLEDQMIYQSFDNNDFYNLKFHGINSEIIKLPKDFDGKTLKIKLIYNPNYKFNLNYKDAYIGDIEGLILKEIFNNTHRFLIAFLFSLFGVFSLYIYFLRFHLKKNILIYFGLYVIFTSVFIFFHPPTPVFFNQNILWWLVFYFSLFFYPLGKLLLFRSILSSKYYGIMNNFIKVQILFLIFSIPLLYTSSSLSFYLFSACIILTYKVFFMTQLLLISILSLLSFWRENIQKKIFSYIITSTSILGIAMLIETFFDFEMKNTDSYWIHFSYLVGLILILEKYFSENIQKIDQFSNELLVVQNELKESKLKSLRDRMSPHFLFNSLNTIHAYLNLNPELADKAIINLAESYRILMDTSNEDLIPFDEEWKILENYIELQKLRFMDKLTVNIEKEGNYDDIKVPPLILQPIIENSFKHGFNQKKDRDWNLVIKITRMDNQINLNVTDNGTGIDEKSNLLNRSLGNIKDRLEHFFKYTEMKIENVKSGGTNIFISFRDLKNYSFE